MGWDFFSVTLLVATDLPAGRQVRQRSLPDLHTD